MHLKIFLQLTNPIVQNLLRVPVSNLASQNFPSFQAYEICFPHCDFLLTRSQGSYGYPFHICLSVCPFVRSHASLDCQMEKRYEILCCVSLITLVEIFIFPSKPNKNNRFFTSRLMYIYPVSPLLNFMAKIICALCALPAGTQKCLLI